MKSYKDKIIIGIDHGYGNIKTANHCFKTGITTHDSEPLFTKDMLIYNGKYYLIGEGHKEFLPEKQNDEDYYILTLAAIATELADEGLTEAERIPENDLIFYEKTDTAGWLILGPGDLVVVAPEDAHCPQCMAGDSPWRISKVVLKVKV